MNLVFLTDYFSPILIQLPWIGYCSDMVFPNSEFSWAPWIGCRGGSTLSLLSGMTFFFRFFYLYLELGLVDYLNSLCHICFSIYTLLLSVLNWNSLIYLLTSNLRGASIHLLSASWKTHMYWVGTRGIWLELVSVLMLLSIHVSKCIWLKFSSTLVVHSFGLWIEANSSSHTFSPYNYS